MNVVFALSRDGHVCSEVRVRYKQIKLLFFLMFIGPCIIFIVE